MTKAKNHKRIWTLEEDNYLEIKWGNTKLEGISKRLGRSVRAIEHRALELGLGGMYRTGEYLMASEVAEMLGVYRTTVCKWITNNGLIAKKVCYKDQPKYRINLEDLVEWLEVNQNKWNANNLEEYALGVEPKWLKEKRKADMNKKPKRTPYTTEEDNRIVSMYKLDYTFEQIAEAVGRTSYMVRHRIVKLRKEGKYKIPYKNGKTQTLSKAV